MDTTDPEEFFRTCCRREVTQALLQKHTNNARTVLRLALTDPAYPLTEKQWEDHAMDQLAVFQKEPLQSLFPGSGDIATVKALRKHCLAQLKVQPLPPAAARKPALPTPDSQSDQNRRNLERVSQEMQAARPQAVQSSPVREPTKVHTHPPACAACGTPPFPQRPVKSPSPQPASPSPSPAEPDKDLYDLATTLPPLDGPSTCGRARSGSIAKRRRRDTAQELAAGVVGFAAALDHQRVADADFKAASRARSEAMPERYDHRNRGGGPAACKLNLEAELAKAKRGWGVAADQLHHAVSRCEELKDQVEACLVELKAARAVVAIIDNAEEKAPQAVKDVFGTSWSEHRKHFP